MGHLITQMGLFMKVSITMDRNMEEERSFGSMDHCMKESSKTESTTAKEGSFIMTGSSAFVI